jgi:hypothetical protein
MSSTSHLTVAQTSETKVNKRHSSFNLRTVPGDDVSSDLLHTSSSKRNSNYLYYLNAEPIRKQSINVTHTLSPESSLNVRRKLSAISLPVPWYRRARSSSDDKTSTGSYSRQQQQPQQKLLNPHRMSRDRILTLDRLFGSVTHTTQSTNGDEQVSPITELTMLEESTKSSEKPMKPIRENGYLHNKSHLLTR